MVKWCQVNKHKTHDQLENTHDFHQFKSFWFRLQQWLFFKVNLQHNVFLGGNLNGNFLSISIKSRNIRIFASAFITERSIYFPVSVFIFLLRNCVQYIKGLRFLSPPPQILVFTMLYKGVFQCNQYLSVIRWVISKLQSLQCFGIWTKLRKQ